jgi:hypothetical protein
MGFSILFERNPGADVPINQCCFFLSVFSEINHADGHASLLCVIFIHFIRQENSELRNTER